MSSGRSGPPPPPPGPDRPNSQPATQTQAADGVVVVVPVRVPPQTEGRARMNKIEALVRERAHYLATGRTDRAAQVKAELQALGADVTDDAPEAATVAPPETATRKPAKSRKPKTKTKTKTVDRGDDGSDG